MHILLFFIVDYGLTEFVCFTRLGVRYWFTTIQYRSTDREETFLISLKSSEMRSKYFGFFSTRAESIQLVDGRWIVNCMLYINMRNRHRHHYQIKAWNIMGILTLTYIFHYLLTRHDSQHNSLLYLSCFTIYLRLTTNWKCMCNINFCFVYFTCIIVLWILL